MNMRVPTHTRDNGLKKKDCSGFVFACDRNPGLIHNLKISL